MTQFDSIINNIKAIEPRKISGKVSAVKGLLVECAGLENFVGIGSRCNITALDNSNIPAEVVGVRDNVIMLMPYTDTYNIGVGCHVVLSQTSSVAYPHDSWMGRVVNALGEPLDDLGSLAKGNRAYPYKNTPPQANKRNRVGGKIDLGVRAINAFVTCCKGQRLGIFSGSGVGKSMLISMLTRFSEAEVKVIGLVGERGREVQEFIQDYLGPEGMKKAVIIVATSNESAIMRRQAAYLTMCVAEYFRDQGKQVLCMIDSITRFAMAQREIGLSAGEPPTSKGYTPTVFSELPKLLERAGPNIGNDGSITGLFSVLVEGDDTNEPISDAVRGILDGHLVLDRNIAERNRFPAINVLRSISRMMPKCNNEEQNALVDRARQLLSTYDNMAEMIRLGAYRKGSDKEVDEAIHYYPLLESFLAQDTDTSSTLDETYQQLADILNLKGQSANPPLNLDTPKTAAENTEEG